MKNSSLVIFLTYFFSFAAQGQKYSEVEKDMLVQLSKGNWQYVYNKINDTIKTPHTDCSRPAVSRILYGHAALITGKNNISTKQFYCACDSTGSRSLDNWFYFTEEFEKGYPSSFVSHYLLGDAYARNGELKKAKQQLDTASILMPENVAVLNCRAVITWLLYENNTFEDERLDLKIAAISDIQKGLSLNPNFADLYANEAIFDMRNAGEVTNTRNELNAAIKIDSTYYLAQNSLAFTYGEVGDIPKYEDIKNLINKYDPQNPFLNLNAVDSNKIDQTNKGTITKLDMGFNFKPGGILAPSFGMNLGIDFDPKGGVYSDLVEGKNLTTIVSKRPIIIGTWFNFNYPNKILSVKK